VNWKKKAASAAKEMHGWYSNKKQLTEALIEQGFTASEAKYGVAHYKTAS
jgi:hypothetical protein